jgi:hypothetical protein
VPSSLGDPENDQKDDEQTDHAQKSDHRPNMMGMVFGGLNSATHSDRGAHSDSGDEHGERDERGDGQQEEDVPETTPRVLTGGMNATRLAKFMVAPKEEEPESELLVRVVPTPGAKNMAKFAVTATLADKNSDSGSDRGHSPRPGDAAFMAAVPQQRENEGDAGGEDLANATKRRKARKQKVPLNLFEKHRENIGNRPPPAHTVSTPWKDYRVRGVSAVGYNPKMAGKNTGAVTVSRGYGDLKIDSDSDSGKDVREEEEVAGNGDENLAGGMQQDSYLDTGLSQTDWQVSATGQTFFLLLQGFGAWMV